MLVMLIVFNIFIILGVFCSHVLFVRLFFIKRLKQRMWTTDFFIETRVNNMHALEFK